MTSRADSADGLAHTLQPRHVAMISFGGIIGAGLFVGSGAAIHIGGPAVLLTYLGCGGLVFLIMRMLGEMAVALPNRGSFADYAAIGLGPWASFVTGWLYWYFWVYTVGAETVAGANLIHDLGISAPVWLIGLVLVAVMTATNLLSVRAYGELEFWFASLKVSAIAAFILVGIAWLVGFGPGAGRSVTMLAQHGGLFPLGISGVLAAVPTVIFSMMGSEVATIAAAESAAPVANVVRAARTVALRILMFYGASILVILLIIPWDSVVPGHSPFAAVLDRMDIPGTSSVMSVIIITAVLSCLNSGLYITSRMLYELARRGEAPASLAMTARNQVPMLGILIGCLAGFGAAIAELFLPDAVFSYLVSTSGDIILFVYMIIAFAQIRLRSRLQQQGRVLSLRMWLFPWLSYGVIGAILGVLLLMGVLPDQRSTLLLSGLSVAIVFAALPLRSRAVTP
jgi:GABA permease